MREKAQSSRSSSRRGRLAAHPGNPSHLVVGTVGRAVGLRGEVDVQVVSDDPNRFAEGSVVYARDRRLTIRSVRSHGERTIVSFEEVSERNGAEALRGIDLVVPVSNARALDESEFWDHDLVGCTVVTTGGEEIGVVTDVLHQPANEVLVVSGDILIPLVASVVTLVEPGARITISPLPGLIGDDRNTRG